MRPFKKILAISAALAALFAVYPQNSWANTPIEISISDKCEALVVEASKELKRYGKEVKKTKGLALVLKDPLPDTSKYWGPFSKSPDQSGLVKRFLQALPRRATKVFLGEAYDLTPLKSLNHYTLRPATQALTAKILKKPKELSTLLVLLGSMSLTNFAYDKGDAIYQRHLEQKLEASIEDQGQQYDSLLKDFRMNALRAGIDEQHLSAHGRHMLTYQGRELERTYFAYLDSTYSAEHEANPAQADQDLFKQRFGAAYFSDLMVLSLNGVPRDVPGFTYQPDTPRQLDAATLDNLIRDRNMMFTKMELVRHWVLNDAEFERVQSIPETKALIDNIAADPYVLQLQGDYNTGVIDQDRFIYLIQEDLFWQNRFEEWKAVKLTRLKKVNGQYSTIPLTLQDIRNEPLDGPK